MIINAEYDDVRQLMGKKYELPEYYSVYEADELRTYKFTEKSIYIEPHFVLEKNGKSQIVNSKKEMLFEENTSASEISSWSEMKILDIKKQKYAILVDEE